MGQARPGQPGFLPARVPGGVRGSGHRPLGEVCGRVRSGAWGSRAALSLGPLRGARGAGGPGGAGGAGPPGGGGGGGGGRMPPFRRERVLWRRRSSLPRYAPGPNQACRPHGASAP